MDKEKITNEREAEKNDKITYEPNKKSDSIRETKEKKPGYSEETKKRLAWRAFEYMMFNDEENQ